MARRSLIEYIAGYPRHGRDTAYAGQYGYRELRSSYQDLAGMAAQFARELEGRGVGPGDRVLLWGRNSTEWVAAFLGCILRGAVVVPIDQGATSGFAGRVARQVDAKLFVAGREHTLDGERRPELALDSLRESVARHSAESYPSPPLDRDSLAEIIFTSGTTAEPKGVVISHGNILANLEPLEAAMQPYLKWERVVHPLRFLNLVPMSHVFGQFLGIWVPPLLGATVVFQDSLNPAEIIRTIKRERVSALIAVPRVLDAVRNKIENDFEAAGRLEVFRREFAAVADEKFLRRIWRFREIHRRFGWKFWAVISGGATLDAETELFWGRIGFAAIQGYGLTETTSLVSVNHPFRVGRGSIGKVLGGREVKLGANGEILVRGNNIAVGYWQDSEVRPIGGDGDDGGWFHTGDLGALDAEGNLYFKGRQKNVIVTPAGMNVYPEDLEAALRCDPDVKDAVVVGLERGGNAEPCAVLLPRDERADAGKIVARANAGLAEYQNMRSWYIWRAADFPRTSTGKPKTGEIREAVNVALRAPSVASRPEALAASANAPAGSVAELIARLHRTPPGAEPAPQTNLGTNLNLTSLDRVELLGVIEDRYQVHLNETQFTAVKTTGELERLVRESSSTDSGAAQPEFVFPRWAQRWPITWIRALIYYLLTWPATHLMAHPRIFGRENLRGVKGPVLVISNHVIYLDVGFVLAALPLRLRHRLAVAMGGERLAEMRRPPREWSFSRRMVHRMNYFLVVALFDVFPLPKRSGFRESFHFAGDLIDRGWSVLVFPEGELTPDGNLQPFRAGIGLLANNLKIPVVPIRIDGAYEIREARRLFNRPGRIHVYIGKPVEFSEDADPQRITRTLEQRMAALGPIGHSQRL